MSIPRRSLKQSLTSSKVAANRPSSCATSGSNNPLNPVNSHPIHSATHTTRPLGFHSVPLTFTDSRPARNDSFYLQRRQFHDYFVTHLPSSSLRPDSRHTFGPSHKLPRDKSVPHTSPVIPQPEEQQAEESIAPAPRAPIAHVQASHHARTTYRPSITRDTTVVRIPLKSAKHHFGASNKRGTRPYNEDTYQAGTIEIPAFAPRAPRSLTVGKGEVESADSESGDPQTFYFGVFDGHGGDKCSHYLRDQLHTYLEDSVTDFGLQSTLKAPERERLRYEQDSTEEPDHHHEEDSRTPTELLKSLIQDWRDTVGGYFRRFKPDYVPVPCGGKGHTLIPSIVGKSSRLEPDPSYPSNPSHASSADDTTPEGSSNRNSTSHNPPTIEQILSYAFLKSDFNFITTQVGGDTKDLGNPSSHSNSDPATNTNSEPDEEEEESLGRHHHHSSPPKPPPPFLGGSTASIALLSTPTSAPYWHPTSPFTLLTAHLGDTRILLAHTSSGDAVAVTPLHHPSNPTEASRLRRFAASFTTDSFGEERFAGGMANTRAFGDVRAKRVGVSAEPSLTRVDAKAGEFAFMVLMSDGVSGVLSDQEVVDVVKEARTPVQGAGDVTSLAEELAVGGQAHVGGEGGGEGKKSNDDAAAAEAATEEEDEDMGLGGGGNSGADNSTCLVVRLGGWERRNEGGGGSLRTREQREWRRKEAGDPRRGRM